MVLVVEKAMNRLLFYLILGQCAYTLITSIWPLVHIKSFMAVTGSKRDVWLVKTVGALLIPIATCLVTVLLLGTDYRPAIVLGALAALAFIIIDVYDVSKKVIARIYLADAAVEFVFLIGYIIVVSTDGWHS